MDAPSLSPERSDELAALRRRAYGPDADIGADAAALDRLRELEDLARPSVPPREEVALPAVDEALGEPVEAAAAEPDPAREESVPDAAAPVADEKVPAWWRRIPIWAIVAASVAVGVGLGAGAVSLATPKPDATLRAAAPDGERPANWANDLSAWGLASGSAQAFGQYDGVGVWMVNSDDGSRCILLEDGGRPLTVGCAGGGLDPVLDLMIYPDMGQVFDTPRPIGSVTRFAGRGSSIEVWERWAQESSAVQTSRSVSLPSAL